METASVISGTQLVGALIIGVAILILLILKTRIHAFIALIIASILIGLISGMGLPSTVASIQQGFGGTLGNIGIIIAFGVMMGQILEITGAAERMARAFLKFFGKGREEGALAATGYLVSIPIFCDSAFVILSSLVKAISHKTKKSIVALGIALAAGLVITHSLIPPTPGPLSVAGTFGIDVGTFILLGLVCSIPLVITTMMYAKWLGKRIYQLPAKDNIHWERPPYQPPVYSEDQIDSKSLPNVWISFAPLFLPIVLILLSTSLNALKLNTGIFSILIFLGTPMIAVGIGLLFSMYTLALHLPRKEVLAQLEKSVQAVGIIILVTGGGGALGKVLQNSGVGNYVAEYFKDISIPMFILPFLVATLVRFAQGSGTVAMITAAGITAPIVQAAGANLYVAALAASMGSLFFSYFNDSFFWVTNRLMGITDAKEQIRVWSVTTTIAWATGFVVLLILNMFV